MGAEQRGTLNEVARIYLRYYPSPSLPKRPATSDSVSDYVGSPIPGTARETRIRFAFGSQVMHEFRLRRSPPRCDGELSS